MTYNSLPTLASPPHPPLHPRCYGVLPTLLFYHSPNAHHFVTPSHTQDGSHSTTEAPWKRLAARLSGHEDEVRAALASADVNSSGSVSVRHAKSSLTAAGFVLRPGELASVAVTFGTAAAATEARLDYAAFLQAVADVAISGACGVSGGGAAPQLSAQDARSLKIRESSKRNAVQAAVLQRQAAGRVSAAMRQRREAEERRRAEEERSEDAKMARAGEVREVAARGRRAAAGRARERARVVSLRDKAAMHSRMEHVAERNEKARSAAVAGKEMAAARLQQYKATQARSRAATEAQKRQDDEDEHAGRGELEEESDGEGTFVKYPRVLNNRGWVKYSPRRRGCISYGSTNICVR